MNYIYGTRKSLGVRAMLALIALVAVGTAILAQAQSYSVLYEFPGGTNAPGGAVGIVAQGRDGNLYGYSYAGGAYNNGTIYEMSPSGTLLNVLYDFEHPDQCGLGLTLGTDGNFYGACQQGGKYNYGYVFRVPPPPAVSTLYDLYDFAGMPDGANPSSRPIEARDGDFYGTTFTGGTNDLGTVYQITPTGANIFSPFSQPDVSYPNGPLFLGTTGNLYGTTQGSPNRFPPPPSNGAVYEITTAGKLTVLHKFAGGVSDGATPARGVIQASDGNFYGTTVQGGTDNLGTIFKMSPAGKVTLLYSFTTAANGYPRVLMQASDGNLYGDANGCLGSDCQGYGSLFGITRDGGTLIFTHDFSGTGGANPDSTLSHTKGTMYGVTGGIREKGRTYDDSVFYSLDSSDLPAFCRPQIVAGTQGSEVKILGQGFDSSSVVKFGNMKARVPLLEGSTFLKVPVPAGALTGPLWVTTGSGKPLKSLQAFQVLPIITRFSPSSGPVGTSVAIRGTSLTQTTKVAFGKIIAEFKVHSDSKITVTVPAGASTGTIDITTKGGVAVTEKEFTVN